MISLNKNMQHIPRIMYMPTQRAHDTMITSLLRQNDVATSIWRNNDVIIVSCVRWEVLWYLLLQSIMSILPISFTVKPKPNGAIVCLIHNNRLYNYSRITYIYIYIYITLENRYGFWPQTGCVTVTGREAAFLVARQRFPYRSRFNFSVKNMEISYRAMQSAT